VLQPDARIEDFLPTLANQEDYVRGIVESFYKDGFNRGEARLRIGVSGTGVAPHYCIEEGRTKTQLKDLNISGYNLRSVFHGKSHKPILGEDAMGISWSNATMSFFEVQEILGRIRASRKAQ
jgi:hypothetical protein